MWETGRASDYDEDEDDGDDYDDEEGDLKSKWRYVGNGRVAKT